MFVSSIWRDVSNDMWRADLWCTENQVGFYGLPDDLAETSLVSLSVQIREFAFCDLTDGLAADWASSLLKNLTRVISSRYITVMLMPRG